jgi:putative ABC transport system permease protein
MIPTALKLALRNLKKYPLLGLLNLTGLALGIAASFVLLLYVYQELTYDRHFRDADRIYRVATDFYNMGGFANSQEVLHQHLKAEFPDVERATRLERNYREVPVEVDDQQYLESGLYYIDSAFFDVFDYELLTGDIQQLQLAPDQVLLTETVARKYFGQQPSWGKTLRIGADRREYTVAGVVRESGGRSHLQPNMFLSIYPGIEPRSNWTSAAVYNYVKLSPQGSRGGFEDGLKNLLREEVYPASGSEEPFEQWAAGGKSVRFFVQPLRDIYLYSDYKFELSAGGNPQLVYILGLVGIFILTISAINYINLSTARSSIRAKEVGIKKTMGANRRLLVAQFLAESVVFGLLAMLLACGLMDLLLSVFENISGAPLGEGSFFNFRYLAALLAFSVLVGMIAGIYPAIYLTGFQPVKILRGEMTVRGNRTLRGSLVILQFAIAIVLMVSSVVVYRQLKFIQNKDLGFEQEGVFIINNYDELEENGTAFREALARRSEVKRISVAARVPAGSSLWVRTYKTPQMEESQTIQTFPVDEHFLPTLDMHLLSGRNFSRELDRDTARTPAIVNEAAVRALGLESDPVGVEINEGERIVGVIRDFNFESMRRRIAPVVLTYAPEGSKLVVKLQGRRMATFIGALNRLWEQFEVKDPLRYYFLDQNFEKLAENEKTLSQAILYFTLLAVIIACLGLFGLAAFTAEQRIKEIGIRKVLGATTAAIAALLSKDFLRYVLWATVIALPLAWWASRRWLEDYAYRISIEWWMLVLPAVTAAVIALITVSWQSIRAANTNPVEALRDE